MLKICDLCIFLSLSVVHRGQVGRACTYKYIILIACQGKKVCALILGCSPDPSGIRADVAYAVVPMENSQYLKRALARHDPDRTTKLYYLIETNSFPYVLFNKN
jgi:hypothetical protein